jgi:hypothetical protein
VATRIANPAVDYRENALVIDCDLSLDGWLDVARGLAGIARGHQWWIGDALVYGEEHFGDEAFQHADEFGLEAHTLTNYRWVASAVELSRRRDELSFSHHAEVARLKPRDQSKALAWAAKQGAGVRELRDYVALTWPQPAAAGEPRGLDPDEDVDVNRRLEQIARALDDGDVDPADVRWLIDLVRRLVR